MKKRENDKSCAVSALVLLVGGTLVILWPFFAIGRAERKAELLGKRISRHSDTHWNEVYTAAERLHAKRFAGERVKVPAEELEPILADLGFDSCSLKSTEVVFRFGGGHMMNTAGVWITLAHDKDTDSGIRIDGWRDFRWIDIAPQLAPTPAEPI